jgi:hypothetical protein
MLQYTGVLMLGDGIFLFPRNDICKIDAIFTKVIKFLWCQMKAKNGQISPKFLEKSSYPE